MATATIIHEQPQPGPAQSLFLQDEQKPDPFTIVIFGATGDLASRKLLPALYSLWHARFLPESFAIVGIGRRDKNDEAFREEMRAAITRSRQDSPTESGAWNGFLDHIFYHRDDFSTSEGMKGISAGVKTLETEQNLPGNRLMYLATDPEYFGPIIQGAVGAGIINDDMKSPWGRAVVEKPFGHDLKSALELDRQILSFLRRTRFIASTTTWEKKRCRTCSPSASATRFSSRSWTASTSITCRSPWPRPSAWKAGAGRITITPAPFATWLRITSCSFWRWWPWNRRPRSGPATSRTPSSSCFAISSPGRLFGVNTGRACRREKRSAHTATKTPWPATRTPIRLSPCAWNWRTGAGAESPSCCDRQAAGQACHGDCNSI